MKFSHLLICGGALVYVLVALVIAIGLPLAAIYFLVTH